MNEYVIKERQIGVGIIGVQPGRSWAAAAHLPALAHLADFYQIVGIANSSPSSSKAAADAFGLAKAFRSSVELMQDPDVDLVVITVKVPNHAELVQQAIRAGKAVYCEWPLALNHAEAEHLAREAAAAGTITAVGMQAVFAPAIMRLRVLRLEGQLGRVLSSTVTGFGMTWGAEIEARNAYLLDRSNGATMLTIAVGHMLSAIEMVLGPISTVSANMAVRRIDTLIRETGVAVASTTPDQVLAALVLTDGTPLSLHYRGGAPRGDGLSWSIDGAAASARIVAPSGLIELAPLTLHVNDGQSRDSWTMLEEPEVDPAMNGVRRLYLALANRLHGGDAVVPDFAAAVRLHMIIAAIEQSAAEARMIRLPPSEPHSIALASDAAG